MSKGLVLPLVALLGAASVAVVARGAAGEPDGAAPPLPRSAPPGAGTTSGAPPGRPVVPPPVSPPTRASAAMTSTRSSGERPPQMGGDCPPPRLVLDAGSSPTGMAPFVFLRRHSVETRVVNGLAVTEIAQTFHNNGERVGEGAWACPLPDGAAVTAFSIFIGGVEHPGRFLRREEARRIYDETVHRVRDPGLVELEADGTVHVRIFPIPPQGDMRIRMTYAHALPVEASACRLVTALHGITPDGAPAVQQVALRVDVQSTWPLRAVETPAVALTARGSGSWRRWGGTATLRQARPEEDLEVNCLIDTDAPRTALHVETAPDGERYFVAIVHAGREGLSDVAVDLGGAASEVYPPALADLTPRSRVLVFGRLTRGDAVDLEVRATTPSGEMVLTAAPERGTGGAVRALWALRKIDDLARRAAATQESTPEIVDVAARAGVLTTHNAILAEE